MPSESTKHNLASGYSAEGFPDLVAKRRAICTKYVLHESDIEIQAVENFSR